MRFGFVLFTFALILPGRVFSQYANEWVQPGQDYYRIPIASKGIYKLTYSDLQNAGVPLASLDPRQIQLIHRGKEQSIHVQGQSDAQFNNDDYIEFYGQANDGTLDKKLYKPITFQPHDYYNLYTDTTAYFLTWSKTGVLGKRLEVFDEVNVTNIPKEEFFWAERLLLFHEQYSAGYAKYEGAEASRVPIQFTHFDLGEGWTGIALRQGEFKDYQVDLINNGVTIEAPQIEILLVGRDENPHNVEVFVGPNAGSLRSIAVQNFVDFETLKINLPINWSDVGVDGKMIVRLSVGTNAVFNARPQLSASYLKLKFPQNFESNGLTEKSFLLKTRPSAKSYVEWVNAPPSMRVWDVTDPSSIRSIGTRAGTNSLTAVVGLTDTPRMLYAFSITHSTSTLQKVSFRSIDPQQANYIIISNKVLMKPALSYSDPVKSYAGYRASEQGGTYDTLVVTIDQLYNQFNYGETSPMAIYEFMRYMVDKGDPKYLFLIGKGRDINGGAYRNSNPGPVVLKDLVPSAGYPGADMNFTVGIGGASYEPAVPTGRLSVNTPTEVANYLNKIKETENPNVIQDWQKRGLHLSGGILLGELPRFRSYMDGFKSTAEGIYWGGLIHTIAKRDPNEKEFSVADQINEGVNLVTFFGHSSTSNVDIDIGMVTNPVLGYNNVGKYPIFLINGCNAGSFFLDAELFGENWVNAANLGARNFIAHTSFGLESTLRSYSNFFYRIGFADSVFIKKGVGDVQKEIARQYMLNAQPSVTNITQVQQMILLGDPAVRMIQAADPDYEINNSSLSLSSFDDKPITALTDSFAIRIIVRNLGIIKNKPITIKVARTFNSGITETYDSTFAPLVYLDTLFFKIHRSEVDGSGTNSFLVQLDPDNKIKELNEDNNEAVLSTNISSSITVNLLPYKFGIENQTTVDFVWQSSNPLDGVREFQLEIDTTLSFNSPYKKQMVRSAKVLASMSVQLLDLDSTVYYWRTRFDKPIEGEPNEWAVSSFSYIKNGLEGWAQLKRNQTKENSFINLVNESDGVPFRFEENKTAVDITTFGSNHPLPHTSVSVRINNDEYNLATQGQPCRNNTINLVAFRKGTAVPYAALPFNFQDPRTCGREPQVINSFALTELETGQGDDLIALVNVINMSDSVAMFSIGDPGYASWSSNIKAKLGELGVDAADLNMLQSGEPIIIFGKKGTSAGSAAFYKTSLTPANEQQIFVSREITGRNAEGHMSSGLIGPAQQWNQFMNSYPAVESSDEASFSIYGVDPSGHETLVAVGIKNTLDLSHISVDEFPYLRLVYEVKDEVNLTPADWKNWVVTYEPAPEGVLLFKGTLSPQHVNEGNNWSTQFAFINISNSHFSDSLKVELAVHTTESQQTSTEHFKIQRPAPRDTTLFNVTSSTIGKAGTNDINVFVNKKIEPEQYYDNNFANLSSYLTIEPDKIKPLLEVTIDDREISNGDFVSSTPVIQLILKDENPFMLKTDTEEVKFFLRYPCNCDFTEIKMSGDTIKWYPATLTSDFRIEFTPTYLVNGEYKLQVNMADASGNWSGVEPYEITFNVMSETTLNYKGVYPNPSSIGFNFSFQLTGNALPDEFSLEILSTIGQLVSKFGIEDVQQFHIGNNEVTWNGNDATGKPLTNGVYIYRLRIKAGTEETVNTGRLVWLR